jgi:hypothetical protein
MISAHDKLLIEAKGYMRDARWRLDRAIAMCENDSPADGLAHHARARGLAAEAVEHAMEAEARLAAVRAEPGTSDTGSVG